MSTDRTAEASQYTTGLTASGATVFLERSLCVSSDSQWRRDPGSAGSGRFDPAPAFQAAHSLLDGCPHVTHGRQLGDGTAAIGDDPLGATLRLAHEPAELRLGLAYANCGAFHDVVIVVCTGMRLEGWLFGEGASAPRSTVGSRDQPPR